MSNNIIMIGPVETSAGTYSAALTSRGLARLSFPTDAPEECARWAARWEPRAELAAPDQRFGELAEQLSEYFAGRLRAFEVALDLRGTPFQLRVWNELLAIGYGQARTYAQLAAAIGAPRGFRAVGAANGANPVPIIVPCHRLVGSGGSLIKYGGGLEVKRRLLELEGVAI